MSETELQKRPRRRKSRKTSRKSKATQSPSPSPSQFLLQPHSPDQATPAGSSDASSASSTLPSAAEPNPANVDFDQVAASILNPLGEKVEGAADSPVGEVIPPEPPKPANIIPEDVWKKILRNISAVVAKRAKDPVFEFEDAELDIFAPAVASIADEKIPGWLQKMFGESLADPRYAALAVGLGIYAMRVGAEKWLAPIIDRMFSGDQEESKDENAAAAKA